METFLTYGDAMLIFSGETEWETIWRKDAVYEAYAKADAERAKEKPDKAFESYCASFSCVEHIAQWSFGITDEESCKGARAQKLVKLWDEEVKTKKKDQWWYELFMQREEPQGKEDPALEVTMGFYEGAEDDGKAGEGTWWVTGFRPADETHPALKHFHDYMPEYY